MIPLRVSLEGFLSYKEKQVINFEGSSLWMLCGPNGVGKSAIFDAITFALYNSHRGSQIKELINHYSERLVVEFDFLVNGVVYRVRRIHPRKGYPVREVVLIEKNASNPSAVHQTPVSGTDSERGFKEWVKSHIGLDYSAFTSSVLLLQGKSEQLLDAGPRGRYSILADLIDLSMYQRLYDAADFHRKNHDARIKMLNNQLGAPVLRSLAEESIKAARSEVAQKDEQWRKAQAEVEYFTKLLEQAKRWEEIVAEINEKQTALQSVIMLLARKDEIGNNFGEWQVLQQILPILQQLIEQRQRIYESQQCSNVLQKELEDVSKCALEAQEKRDLVMDRASKLAQVIEHLQANIELRQCRLTELAPTLAKFAQVESLQEQVAELQVQMRMFPSDLAQHMQEAEQKVKQLAEREKVLPWMKLFAQARSDLAKVVADEQDADAQAEILQTRLQECEDHREQLNAEWLEAQGAERVLLAKKTSASTRYQDACKRFERFEDAATKPVCELCGQEITEEHAQQEKVRLHQQMEDARDTYEKQKLLHHRTLDLQRRIEKDIASLDVKIKQVTREHDEYQTKQRSNQSQAKQHALQLQRAFENIPSPFKECIITAIPGEDIGWLETTYPTNAELEALQQEILGKTEHENNLNDLSEQYEKWKNIQAKKAFADEQSAQLLASFDLESAREARNEKSSIDHELTHLETDINQERESHSQQEMLIQETSKNYAMLEKEKQELQNQLAAERVKQEVMSQNVQMFIQSVPVAWQTHAESLSIEELDQLERKRESLALYKLQYEQLEQAQKDKTSYEQCINELQDLVVAYPSEASRPAVEVERELSHKKAGQLAIDKGRNRARERLAQLQQQWEHRMELEQQKCKAERRHHLYKLLKDLLGPGGLQLHLLHEAESVITDLANQTLSGLSHGRMRLELRRESETSSVSTDKALDLLVYDRDTNQYSIPINLASGSQRFRIAVSMALAIGRYSNRAAHHIESVIIDEGFGSLDKAGRDDMMQELNTLGQQLARIIVVSHQDDFATTFANRYSFKLVDKASCVTLVGDDFTTIL